MKLTILGLMLSFAISAFSNEVNFNKVFTPEAAKIGSIIKMDGSYYVSTDFAIFQSNDLEGNWNMIHEIEIDGDPFEASINKLFVLGNESFSILSYLTAGGDIFYEFMGIFEEYDVPVELQGLEVTDVKQMESGRVFVTTQSNSSSEELLFELVSENLDVLIVPFSNQTTIDGVAEDELGRIWVVGNELEIHVKGASSSRSFGLSINSDIAVQDNKIYYSDGEDIFYYDYSNREAVLLDITGLQDRNFDEFSLGFERISDTEIVFHSGEARSGIGHLIKINSDTDESTIITEEFESFLNVLFDSDMDQLLVGTAKSLLYSDLDFNFSESSKGLSGFFSFFPHYTENFFIGYTTNVSSYGINRKTGNPVDLQIQEEEGEEIEFRLVIGESNGNLISYSTDLSYSEDGGSTWESSNLILSDLEDALPSYQLEYHNNQIYYGIKNQIVTSIDDGKNWNIIVDLEFEQDSYIKSLYILNSNKFIISTDDGIFQYDGELTQIALDGFEITDAKVINHLGNEYLVAVYSDDESNYYIYRQNLTTNNEVSIPLDFDIVDPFNEVGVFACITDEGNVLLSDFVDAKNYVAYINKSELEEFEVEGDIIMSFRENNEGQYIGAGLKGRIYTIETTLSVDGNYELKIDKVYPNPANNFIQLKDIQNNTLVEITDISGNTFETRYNSGIDISRVGTGMYFVKYQNTNGEFVTSKFIKE